MRFSKLDDLALGLIDDTIGAVGVDEFIERYEGSRKVRGGREG